MPQEFGGDLTGAEFWGADLRGARFRDVDLTGTRITHAWVVDVEIDAVVDRLVVNGVDVTDYVHERDRWHRVRSLLRASTPEDMSTEWAGLEEEWAATTARARALPEEALHESIDGEFSFVQTVRHLVFAIDKWFTAPIVGGSFSPIGLANTGSLDFPWPEVDRAAQPRADEALAVWDDRATAVRAFLATVEPDDLDRPIDVLENGACPLREGISTVFEEVFWHNRYALRDLEALEAARAAR
jgi:hypothetical protein